MAAMRTTARRVPAGGEDLPYRWGRLRQSEVGRAEGADCQGRGRRHPRDERDWVCSWFPSSVARELKGRDITLKVRKNGVTYTLNGEKIGLIAKLWYNFDENLESTLQPAQD